MVIIKFIINSVILISLLLIIFLSEIIRITINSSVFIETHQLFKPH